MTKTAVWLMITAFLAAAPPAAQDASELLQKGIYTQETLGDLDGAARIYREVISLASQNRIYAAQAQYRLATCLLKKGDTSEAVKAFEKLIADYPEEKELVAKAQEHLPTGPALLPAPWEDGEILEMRMRMAGGMPVGLHVYHIDAAGNPDRWVIQTRIYTPGGNALNTAEVERDTMQPIAGSQKLPMLGEAHVTYQKGLAVVTTKGSSRTVKIGEPVLENESALYYLRRMPLQPGRKVPITVFSALGGVPAKMDFEVTGFEDVQVPAGTFRSFRLHLGTLNQTFWIAADPSRRIVKWEANNFVCELQAVNRTNALTSTTQQNQKFGYALTLPPGWITASMPSPNNLLLADPESAGVAYLWANNKPTAREAIAQSLREDVERKIKEQSEAYKDYKVRPESLGPRPIGKYSGYSYIADFEEQGNPMTEYRVWVQSESVFVLFIAKAEPGKIDEFSRRLNRIIETVQLK